MRAVNKNRSSPALASIRDPVVPRRAFRRRCGPALALLTCLPHYKPWDAREQRQPRRSADGALMWVLPCAWSYARACTRPCFLSSVFFSCGFVPDGDEFAEACASGVIGLDDVSHGRITLDSQGRTSLERGGASSCTAARCMLGGSARDTQDALALSPTRAQHSEEYATL